MNGSGLATMKQFLLSIVATTISIVLTFGTAGWLEGRNKNAAKHEMVMTILYDLNTSIDKMAAVDSLLRAGFEKQVEVAGNPKLLADNQFIFIHMLPSLQYTETVERIFSSNIETINTIGNVLFAENVSRFYFLRKEYKKELVDSFRVELANATPSIREYDGVMNIDYAIKIEVSGELLSEMRSIFTQCKHMMKVSDKELDAYYAKRSEKALAIDADSTSQALKNEMFSNISRLKEAIDKGKGK